MREIYTPIFDGFFDGSLMLEEVPTRFLFLVMLRLAGRPGSEGEVDIPLPRLAALAAMSEDATRKALDALLRPDKLSGSKLEQGRRIVQLNAKQPDRGWRVVNSEKYVDAVHRANDAARKRRERGDRRDLMDQNVRKRPGASENGENGGNGATIRDDLRNKRRPPLAPRSGGPSKKAPRLGEIRRFNSSMTGASLTAYAKAYKQRFGVLPPASSRKVP
jgi:hypothetical protein